MAYLRRLAKEIDAWHATAVRVLKAPRITIVADLEKAYDQISLRQDHIRALPVDDTLKPMRDQYVEALNGLRWGLRDLRKGIEKGDLLSRAGGIRDFLASYAAGRPAAFR